MPAAVSVRVTVSDSTLARQMLMAAAGGPRKASGTVLHSARMAAVSMPTMLRPPGTPRATASVTAASPSRTPATAGACRVARAAGIRLPQAAQPPCPSATMPVNHHPT